MATRPKAVIESRNGEEFSPITIAKNVLFENGQNLQDVLGDRKEDMMTPTIENSSSMFKVGQGDGVDYSDNVVNGAYESLVLKGVTKFIDNGTGEILDSFVENRDLSLIDCKSPILSNVGKNLFDVNQTPSYVAKNTTYSIVNNEITINSTGATNYPRIIYTLDKKLLGKTIFVSYDVVKNTSNNWILQLVYTKIDGVTDYRNCRAGIPITLPNEITGDLTIGIYADNTSATGTAHTLILKNIQIEEGSATTPYEPYKSNTTTFEQKDGKTIVLRSLPNGVCDTLNVETGEYVQRIGEGVFNGSENWLLENFVHDTLIEFKLASDYRVKSDNSLICDSFALTLQNNVERIYMFANGGVYVRILKSKVASVGDFKQYLQTNPLTIQYELTTPIVKQVNVEGYPYSYENGHVLLKSGSQEQSLTPIIEYSIVANRGGQIRSNQRMVERQQKQLDRLQAMILANLVNTRYEQTLTNLKYDLKNVREEVK